MYMNPSQKETKFKSNYDDWAQPLFRFIYFKSKDKQLAQDIVQDTFVKYWDKMDSVAEGKEKSYIYTTAKNLLLNTYEHNKVVQNYEKANPTQDKVSSPLYDLEVSEFKQKLEKAIDELPENQREVFVMHRIDGYKYKEIATLLDISQKAVEKRMSQALKSLRKICIRI